MPVFLEARYPGVHLKLISAALKHHLGRGVGTVETPKTSCEHFMLKINLTRPPPSAQISGQTLFWVCL